jgi:uncharacterized protein YuzE
VRITYDPEVDALAIVLREDAQFEDSTELEEGVTAMLDGRGGVIGLEVLDAKRRLGTDPLDCISIERLSAATDHE